MDTVSAHPLHIEPATGLLARTRQVLSPHFDARPGGLWPELIVVHCISLPPGEYGGPWIEHLFTGTLPRDAPSLFRDHSAGQGLGARAHPPRRHAAAVRALRRAGLARRACRQYQGRGGLQ